MQSSEYAELAGIPVAWLGLAAYLALLGSAVSARVEAAGAAAAVALGGLLFSAYLLVVQLAVIDAVCVWCLASDAVMALLAGVTVLRLRALSAPPA